MLKKISGFLKNEEGATAIEYGIIVGLIAAVILVVLGTMGNDLNTMFTSIAAVLP
jgi:pilus assembly protein Flp/PilA